MSKEKLCIIDGDSLIYIHSWLNRDEDDFYIHKQSISKHIENIIAGSGASKYLGFLSLGSIRKDIAKTKEYKGNRKDRKKPKFFLDYKNFVMEELGFTIYKGLEADDLCKIANDGLKDDFDIVIATIDKDLKQFPATFYDYKHELEEVVDEDTAQYNLWYQVLIGDSTDNIPGLEGIGPVKAKAILDKIATKNLMHTTIDAYTHKLGLREGIISLAENFQLVHLLDKWEFDESPIQIREITMLDNWS